MKTNTNSKRAVAVAIFNSKLKTLSKVGGREFRKNVLESIEADTGVTRACAAAMYNHAKKLATAANPKLELGRVAKAAEDTVVEPVAVENTDTWAVVDADGNVVGTYASRAKARAAKGEGQRAVAR